MNIRLDKNVTDFLQFRLKEIVEIIKNRVE